VSAVATVISPGADVEENLRAGLGRGDPSAAEDLVARFGDRAYRLAVRITRNAEDAEEAVQDAFLSVIRKVDTFRGDAAFGSWFYRIVANAACQKIRRQRGARVVVALDDVTAVLDANGELGVDWSARVEDPALREELRRVLAAALDALPAESRMVVVLRDVDGFSNHEVSAALRITVANVKTRVHRARLFLRKRLASYMAVTLAPPHASQVWKEVRGS
jgi:RNA polymerase sigma-70 factor (ECF subfamily)